MRYAVVTSVALLLCVGGLLADHPQQGSDAGEHVMVVPSEMDWGPAPAALPPGAQAIVLEGDPAKPGLFTMRAKLPPNYRIPPHTHPKVERVTVLSGTLRLGTGASFDEAAMTDLPAGSFFAMPVGMQHFAATGSEGTVLQLNCEGPWDIIYVNPADDPRKSQR